MYINIYIYTCTNICNLCGIDVSTYIRVYVVVRLYITWKKTALEKELVLVYIIVLKKTEQRRHQY